MTASDYYHVWPGKDKKVIYLSQLDSVHQISDVQPEVT